MSVKVGLIGCGEHGAGTLLPTLLRVPNVSLVAVCDVDAAKAEGAASRWNIPQSFADPNELLELEGLQALVMAASPQAHENISSRALARRIPVFVEKPPATSLAAMRTLAEAAQISGVTTQVGHNFRHLKVIEELQACIEAPWFGAPILLTGEYFASWPKTGRWGIESPLKAFMLTHVIHLVDIVFALLGAPAAVDASVKVARGSGAIALSFELRYDSGPLVVMHATNCSPRFQFRLTCVAESNSVASLDGFHSLRAIDGTAKKGWSDTWSLGQFERGMDFAGYLPELTDFFGAVQSGAQGSPSFAEEVAVYEIMDAIERTYEEAP